MLTLIVAALSAPWTLIPSDNADGAAMRAHLHAVFEARELLYDDEYAALLLGYGLLANLHLQHRTDALIEQQPDRIEQARARLNPWHEAWVEQVPSHQALLRARLGPGV